MAEPEYVNVDDHTGEPVEIVKVDNVLEWTSRQDAAMLDVQVATAKAYPRSVQKFQAELKAWATLNRDTAAECFFALPRDGKKILGPSIRFAELIQAAYGNLIVESSIVDEGRNNVVVSATCRDLERNIASRAQVRRNIVTSKGKRYGDSMVEQTMMAASAIARRNAIFQCVPKALWLPIWEECKRVASGDAQDFAARRKAVLEGVKAAGADSKNVKLYLGGKEPKDLTADDVLLLELELRAIRNGEKTAAQAFPDPVPDEPERGRSAERARDALKTAAEPKSEEPDPTAAAFDLESE